MTNLTLAEELGKSLVKGLGDEAKKIEESSDPVKWIEKNFYIPETKQDPILKGHLQLQTYQADALREALSRDEQGLYKYSIILWSDIKKSIKSTIAAAVNLYGTEMGEFGERYIIANDLKQADSRVAHYIRRAILLNPKFENKYKTRGYRVTAPNGSYMEAIPIDPSGEAGSNADMLTFSELWGAHQEAQRTMWAEMTLSPTKFGKSFRWIETYAGTVGQSDLLYELYQTGVQQGQLLWPDRLYPVTDGEPAPLELYVNRTARMLCLWNTKPRCPWQTKEYYASEQAVLLPNQFARMHRNQWTSGSDSFVPMEWWDSCNHIPEPWPELPKNHPMVISLDAGVSSDNFGLVMSCRHPKFPDEVMLQYAQRWVPPTGGKIDFVGNVDNPGPEMVVDKLVDSHNVVEVAYDPYQLHDMAERQKKKNKTWWRAFGQGNERLESDNQLRTLIRDKRVWHRGEPVVREHMENADGQVDDEERKVRIVKRAEKLKIDLTVCQSMGYHELLRLNL